MTIHLSEDVQNTIDAAVRSGRFASADEMIASLVYEYARRHPEPLSAPGPESRDTPNLGSIGALREDAELLDEIVADVYRRRREETWRELDLRARPCSTRTSTPK